MCWITIVVEFEWDACYREKWQKLHHGSHFVAGLGFPLHDGLVGKSFGSGAVETGSITLFLLPRECYPQGEGIPWESVFGALQGVRG